MPYRERLYPWVLVRLLPKMQGVTVAQYRSPPPSDAKCPICGDV
ncbi:MAG: hypothetical protein RLP02_10005 [Coleofasciculus sp. C2-GNP5-27]